MTYALPGVSPLVAALQARRYRQMSPDEKLALADVLWELSWEATKAGVRLRHPEFDERAIERDALAIMDRAAE